MCRGGLSSPRGRQMEALTLRGHHLRLPAMSLMVAAATALTVYCHHGLHTAVVFTHAFYIPILLGVHWWGSRGVVVAAVLAAVLLASRLATHDALGVPEDLLRAAMFVGVGGVFARFAHLASRKAAEVRRLERQIVTTTEQTQQQVGRDLHDDICQRLTGLSFLAESLAIRLHDRAPDEAADAGAVATGLMAAADQTRRVARGLVPVMLERGDLMTALDDLARSVAATHRCECRATAEPPAPDCDPDVAVQLYRIAQEAASNAVRHGQAKRIDIRLEAGESHLVLRIRDDGRGWPAAELRGRGLGVATMAYRADAIGGRLTIAGHQNGGTEVCCRVDTDRERS